MSSNSGFRKYRVFWISALALFGATIGVGIYTFIYAKGYSYLTNDPAACMNCHVMRNHYDAWLKSSHHSVATCNDCHTPANFVGKYYTKALNGFWHSFAFTTGRFPDVIRINRRNSKVAADACVKCHADIIRDVGTNRPIGHGRSEFSCVKCHNAVGHPD